MANVKERERTAKRNIESWEQSEADQLYKVYGKYSANKAKAFEYCKELMYKMDGERLRIISHNTFIFTAGFRFIDKETGVIRFMFITPSYNTAVDM